MVFIFKPSCGKIKWVVIRGNIKWVVIIMNKVSLTTHDIFLKGFFGDNNQILEHSQSMMLHEEVVL